MILLLKKRIKEGYIDPFQEEEDGIDLSFFMPKQMRYKRREYDIQRNEKYLTYNAQIQGAHRKNTRGYSRDMDLTHKMI